MYSISDILFVNIQSENIIKNNKNNFKRNIRITIRDSDLGYENRK